jgi:hypothetical protein
MKYDASLISKRSIAAVILLAGLIGTTPLQEAVATNDVSASCQIGSSSSCPAQSPQEIYNLYGTTTNGAYWLNVNGTATQTFLILDPTYPDGGMWYLGMKGTKTSSNFNYSSTNWTSQSTTLNTNSLSNDVATDAKFEAFNYLPASKVLAVFKDRSSYNFSTSGTGMYNPNSFGGHVWKEDISSQTLFSRFTTNSILYSQTGAMTRYDLYRESNSPSANLVFAYQNGYAKYGFNYNNASATYRWGIAFNNENDDPRIDSSDAQAGIGLTGYGAASVYTYPDASGFSINSGTGLNNGAAATYASGFQIWGKMAAPSMPAPGSLTRSLVGNGSVQLNIGAASGATEYALQYKLSTDTWASSTTVRVTNPSASPTAVVSGLATGTYDFRVWTRGTNNSSNSAASLLSQTIDSTAPNVGSATYSTSPNSGYIYTLGETVSVQFTFAETVTVTGSPRIPITGMSGKYFVYSSGSGTKVLKFSYVVAVGDLNTAGVGIAGNSLEMNGGSIKDLALNDSLLTNQALNPNGFNQLDGIVPTVTSVATSTDGQKVVITLSDTQSANALTGTPFNVSVNGTRSVVTTALQSGPRITLTLTFGVVAGDTVQITYTDPTANNDTYALQDLAGNDVATFTMSVTNSSTATSNTTITLRVSPDTTTAIYRLNNSIIATVSAAGKVDFKLQGKILPGCRNVATTGSGPITATCTWKPSIHNSVTVTATLKPSGVGFMNSNASPLSVFVLKRTNTR